MNDLNSLSLTKEELEFIDTKRFLGIIYGGSVDSYCAERIISLDSVDGLLLGGASLEESEFSNIALNAGNN